MLRANKGRSIKGVGPKDRVSQSIYLVLETLQQAASSGDEWTIAHRPNVARRATARCRLVARPRWYGQSGHRRGHDGALVSSRICSDLLRPGVWTSFLSGSTLKKVDPTGTAAIGACWFSEAIRQAKFTARFNGTPALVRPHRLLLTRRMVRAFLPLHTIFCRSRGDIPYWELLGVGCLHRVPTDLPHCSFSVL